MVNDELNEMYLQKSTINATLNNTAGLPHHDILGANSWSSTESSATKVWLQHMGNGTQSASSKSTNGVWSRVVRAFSI